MDFRNIKMVTDYFSGLPMPGGAVLIKKDHEVLYRYSSGFADIEAGVPFTGDESVFLYSCTKMFTCTAALQLYEKGLLNLDDPLSRFYPEADKRITLKHLFSMTAGYDYDMDCLEHFRGGHAGTQEIVREIVKKPLRFAPGTSYLYSLAHDIIGGIVELVSGERFSDYIDGHILKPLGLKNTTFRVTDEVLGKIAPQYMFDKNAGKSLRVDKANIYAFTQEYDSGGAGLVSTLSDLSVFLDALACGGVGETGNRILKEDTIKLYSTNVLSPDILRIFNFLEPSLVGHGYALGVRTFIDPVYGDGLIPVGEFGWGGAASSQEIVDPVNHISLAYTTHVLEGPQSQLVAQLLHALYLDLSEKL